MLKDGVNIKFRVRGAKRDTMSRNDRKGIEYRLSVESAVESATHVLCIRTSKELLVVQGMHRTSRATGYYYVQGT